MQVKIGEVDLKDHLISCEVSISGGESNSRASLVLAIDALPYMTLQAWITISGDGYAFAFKVKSYDVRLNGQITVTGAGIRSEPLLPPGYSRVSLATLAKTLDPTVSIPPAARTVYAGIDAGLKSTAATLHFLARSAGLVVTDTGGKLYLRDSVIKRHIEVVEYTEEVTPEGIRISMVLPLSPGVLPGDVVNGLTVTEIDHDLTGTTSTITATK